MYPYPDAPWFGSFVREQVESLRAAGVEADVAAHLGQVSRWHYARGAFEIARRLRANRYDLIHSHHTYSTVLALMGRALARRRVPIVETFHESEIFHRRRAYGQDPVRRIKYSLRLKAWALRRVDFAIPVQRDMLRIVLGDDAARVRSRVIPMGIDLRRFTDADPRAARAKLGWNPEGDYILFPCDPRKPEKRHDLARAAFDAFARHRPGAQLIVGGHIEREAMPAHIQASDVVLVPTDYEASPTVVKEAMACERPVVSTDVGDVKECYGDLPGILLCDWRVEDVAVKLERAFALRQRPFGGRARVEALSLDLPDVARRVIEVYEEVKSNVK
jgi:glycosyltransferase involved in cell wall biosynthesis